MIMNVLYILHVLRFCISIVEAIHFSGKLRVCITELIFIHQLLESVQFVLS